MTARALALLLMAASLLLVPAASAQKSERR